MVILLTILHVIVCLFLIIVVLLQSGKAADLAGAFGGMGSQTAFGPRGAATVLSKATTIAAGLFMVTSLSLAILATRNAGGASSVLERTKGPAKSSPAKPAVPAPAQPTPGVAPGQPSVTLTPEGGGPSQTLPLDLEKMKQAQPPAQQQQQAPAQQKK